MNKSRFYNVVIFAAGLSFVGCNGPNYNQGFSIRTNERLISANGTLGPAFPIPFAPVAGNWIPDQHQQGSVTSFDNTTDVIGIGVYVSNGRAPAYWDMYATFPFFCDTNHLLGQPSPTQYLYEFSNLWVNNLDTVELDCLTYAVAPASSRFAIVGSFPSTITLGAQAPLSTASAAPQMNVYDAYNDFVTSVSASTVASDGSSATFPFPSSLSQNAYTVALTNTNSDGSRSSAGGNFLSVASSQAVSGNPFGVAVASLSETDQASPCGHGRYTTTFPVAIPVVTLYSLSQVLIAGGTAVPVGPNPTAVVAYSGPAETINTSVQCDIRSSNYAGMTRAIVANSGSNTATILDVINHSVLGTIQVGNNPVALAVSSDGTTGYVANYGDGTITQINLTTMTPMATLTVGGQPSSLTLTAAGTLWVGSATSIFQINPQTMTVTAVQSIPRSIVSLGYSNSLNQLVATTVDATGNVFMENVDPTTIVTGHAYSPRAANQVSSLGTYSGSSRGTVQAFSRTVGGSNQSAIGVNQIGAPPLVVQDGWAVISATPTGFSVSDITGNVVLISEQTPSPITAIAVDTKLSVAYLTMPDSNILLTVPLPGTP